MQEPGITALHIKLWVTVGNRTKTPAPGVHSALGACACLGMKIGQIEDVIPTPSDHTCKMGVSSCGIGVTFGGGLQALRSQARASSGL
ncbi:hypothetical protein GH733_006929 [Mirounga leonina]|nr:hypothetical protein GH733_006929 [Mirounga leonina]